MPDSTPAIEANKKSGGIAADHLRSFVDRLERLAEEKKAIADDMKEVMAEAKGTGFEPAIIRLILRLRKKGQEERQEEEALVEMYKAALGME